jgi:hypothetical protein
VGARLALDFYSYIHENRSTTRFRRPRRLRPVPADAESFKAMYLWNVHELTAALGAPGGCLGGRMHSGAHARRLLTDPASLVPQACA